MENSSDEEPEIEFEDDVEDIEELDDIEDLDDLDVESEEDDDKEEDESKENEENEDDDDDYDNQDEIDGEIDEPDDQEDSASDNEEFGYTGEDSQLLKDVQISLISKIDPHNFLKQYKTILKKRVAGNASKVSKAIVKEFKKEYTELEDPVYLWQDVRELGKSLINETNLNSKDKTDLEKALHDLASTITDYKNKEEQTLHYKETYVDQLYRILVSVTSENISTIISELKSIGSRIIVGELPNKKKEIQKELVYNSFSFRDEINVDNMETSNLLEKPKVTDGPPCKKCKSTRTFVISVQTRSSDEPMTQFSTCLQCGYRDRL